MEQDNEKNRPIVKKVVGRFQVSVWKQKRLFQARTDFDTEREVETVRACVQYSRFNRATRSYDNQQVWCNLDELLDLANALDTLNDEDKSGEKAGKDSGD